MKLTAVILSALLCWSSAEPFRSRDGSDSTGANSGVTHDAIDETRSEHAAKTRTDTCGIALEDMLPLLRMHPMSTMVYQHPHEVMKTLRELVGPKPEKLKLQSPLNLPTSIRSLVSMAAKNPQLVKAIAKSDPEYIQEFVNAVLGLDE